MQSKDIVFGYLDDIYLNTAAYLHQHNTVLCIGKCAGDSGGSAEDSKIEDHEGRCLGLKGINSFPA